MLLPCRCGVSLCWSNRNHGILAILNRASRSTDGIVAEKRLSDKWISGPIWRRHLSANATFRPL
jgi:hypothetical protein